MDGGCWLIVACRRARRPVPDLSEDLQSDDEQPLIRGGVLRREQAIRTILLVAVPAFSWRAATRPGLQYAKSQTMLMICATGGYRGRRTQPRRHPVERDPLPQRAKWLMINCQFLRGVRRAREVRAKPHGGLLTLVLGALSRPRNLARTTWPFVTKWVDFLRTCTVELDHRPGPPERGLRRPSHACPARRRLGGRVERTPARWRLRRCRPRPRLASHDFLGGAATKGWPNQPLVNRGHAAAGLHFKLSPPV